MPPELLPLKLQVTNDTLEPVDPKLCIKMLIRLCVLHPEVHPQGVHVGGHLVAYTTGGRSRGRRWCLERRLQVGVEQCLDCLQCGMVEENMLQAEGCGLVRTGQRTL